MTCLNLFNLRCLRGNKDILRSLTSGNCYRGNNDMATPKKNASLDIVPRKFHFNFQSDRLNGAALALSSRQKIGMKIRVTHHCLVVGGAFKVTLATLVLEEKDPF